MRTDPLFVSLIFNGEALIFYHDNACMGLLSFHPLVLTTRQVCYVRRGCTVLRSRRNGWLPVIVAFTVVDIALFDWFRTASWDCQIVAGIWTRIDRFHFTLTFL